MWPLLPLRKLAKLLAVGLLAGAWPALAAEPAADAAPRASLIPFPFLFYSDETELGGGASLNYVTRRASTRPEDPGESEPRPANYGMLAVYTAREQYALGFSVDRYFADERWHLVSGVNFEEFPGDFFGFGNRTHADSSEVYTPRGMSFAFNLERTLAGRWQSGPSLAWLTRSIVEREPAGRLERDRPVGWDEGSLMRLGWTLTWDGRSQVFAPQSGGWARLETSFARDDLIGDFSFTHHSVDLRHYRRLGRARADDRRGHAVLALRTLCLHTAGSVPFDQMPTLGGSALLRGYFGGRFRDHSLVAAQAELRTGHWKRLGAVVFGEAGTVADGLGALSVADLHAVFGLGLRWQLSAAERIHVRADLGFSDDGGSGLYLAFLEAY